MFGAEQLTWANLVIDDRKRPVHLPWEPKDNLPGAGDLSQFPNNPRAGLGHLAFFPKDPLAQLGDLARPRRARPTPRDELRSGGDERGQQASADVRRALSSDRGVARGHDRRDPGARCPARHVAPGKRHRRAARAAGDALRGFDAALGGRGWWIEIEAEIRFPGDRLAVPDLSGWRVERVPELPDDTVLPDWCCEILSPTTARDDKRLKLPLYAECGVAWSWLVDPELRLVEVFETMRGLPAFRATAKDDDVVRLPPFEGEIAFGGWWLPPP
jgi:hypothetical protein